MVTNDATILKLKHDVLYEVAKLAWEDQLVDDKRDELPGKMIPGPQAHYRCCIYKEREVIRQRSVLRKASALREETRIMWSRSSMRPVRSARLPPIRLRTTAVNVWVRRARAPVPSEPLRWAIIRRLLTRTNAVSAVNVRQPARTMPSLIWNDPVKRCVRWTPSLTTSTVSA